MNIHKFLESVAANASRNFKLEQLEANKDNELLREVIRLALCPFTQFYQRKIPAYTPNTTSHAASLQSMLPAFYDLHTRSITGNAAIDHLRSMLEAVSPDDAKVIERIIQKDLRAGFSASTSNKVWMGLVHEYPVMLCSPFEQKLVDKIKWPATVQLKMDGMRFNAIVRDGKCEFRSRNGKEIQLLGNLEEDFIKMAGVVDCVFDGELLVMEGDKILDRQTGNGILNKANKGTISKADAAKVRATVWDIIPYVMFETGYCATPYSQRIDTLANLLATHEPEKVYLVQKTTVENIEEANVIFERYLSMGQEGIILKDLSGVWEDKRSKTQIKFKGELECDLKIVGIEEGTGKYVGMTGAIICESADGVIKVRVGSGFNDAQRYNIWVDRNVIVDKIAAIKYNTRIKNKAGEESLFLPIILEIRDDKEVADSSKDIK
jgi:ATP-dependent DNA ligase